LVAPHDPKPLLAQAQERYEGPVTVEYLVSGPQEWVLRLTAPPEARPRSTGAGTHGRGTAVGGARALPEAPQTDQLRGPVPVAPGVRSCQPSRSSPLIERRSPGAG